MKKTTLYTFLLCIITPTYITPSSAPIKTMGGGILAIIGSTGTIYCYKKTKFLSKSLTKTSKDDLIYKALQKHHKRYKILTFVCGGIALLGIGLSSLGAYEWATENNVTQENDSFKIGEEKPISYGRETIITITKQPDGTFLVREYKKNNFGNQEQPIKEKLFSKEELKQLITPVHNQKFNTYSTMPEEKLSSKQEEFKFYKHYHDLLLRFIKNPGASFSFEELITMLCGGNALQLL